MLITVISKVKNATFGHSDEFPGDLGCRLRQKKVWISRMQNTPLNQDLEQGGAKTSTLRKIFDLFLQLFHHVGAGVGIAEHRWESH